MKFVLIACIIIAAAGSAQALDTAEITKAAIREFTPYHPSLFEWTTVSSIKVKDDNGHELTCDAQLFERPLKGNLVIVRIDCGGEVQWLSFYKDSPANSSSSQYYYYDENKQKHFLSLKKAAEVLQS